MINELSKQIHENAKSKGFYDGEKNIAEMLMLIVTEVAEACEADRKDNHTDMNLFERELKANSIHGEKYAFDAAFKIQIKNTFEDELADIMIRVMDLAAYKGIDLENHIALKMKYNSMREYKHGKKY